MGFMLPNQAVSYDNAGARVNFVKNPKAPQAQTNEAKVAEKAVPSSTDPAAVISGVTAPPAAGPAAVLDMSGRTESQESTATIDSMTSDDADSLDTAMPPRHYGHHLQPRAIVQPTLCRKWPA